MTMFQPRTQGVFDLTASRVFTDAETALIDERRAYLITVHTDQARMVPASVLAPWAPQNTLGSVLWLRELGFAKLAILSRGGPLIDHWSSIKRERDIPLQTLAWEISAGEFARSSLTWESKFYKYIMASEQDELTRRLNQDRWIFGEIEDLPGFSLIPSIEALYFYGDVGGDVPHFHHISVTRNHRIITMVGGSTYDVQFRAEGGEPPIVWSVAGPDWMTIDDTGLVHLAPPELPAGTIGAKDVYAAVTAKGQQDAEGHASLTVTLLPIV